MLFKSMRFVFASLLAGLILSGCNQVKTDAGDASAKAAANTVAEIYEVHHDGRINVFYDRKTYQEFLQLGETSYRLTRIGDGPNGETVVFGLTKDDKKKGANTPAVKLYENKATAADNFYAETRRHDRIYVFSTFSDMTTVRQFGHPNFFYTEIGAGPKGETVVFVLNSSNKKKKPVELMAAFKKRNS